MTSKRTMPDARQDIEEHESRIDALERRLGKLGAGGPCCPRIEAVFADSSNDIVFDYYDSADWTTSTPLTFELDKITRLHIAARWNLKYENPPGGSVLNVETILGDDVIGGVFGRSRDRRILTHDSGTGGAHTDLGVGFHSWTVEDFPAGPHAIRPILSGWDTDYMDAPTLFVVEAIWGQALDSQVLWSAEFPGGF